GGTETFSFFPASPHISGENVVFGATGGELAALGGIFAYIDGSLRLIADPKTRVPGHDTTFNGFFLRDSNGDEGSRPAISGENVVFLADAFVPGEHHVTGVYAFLPVDVAGDFDGNGRIELRDAAAFQRCMGRSNAELDQRDNCLCLFDADENGAIDLTDFAAFQAAILGP
ncbi:MAG: hypothetical protein IH897_10580, partial [Planctomycetes bacterium]|nr:hypothetical protein [Planctomycetota bacterium]